MRARVVGRPRTSPRACGPARRRPRPTPARRRTRSRRRRSARRSRRDAATPTVDVSTTWVVTRSLAATSSRGHRARTPRRRAGCTRRRRRARATSATDAHVRRPRRARGRDRRRRAPTTREPAPHEVRRERAAHVAEPDEPDRAPRSAVVRARPRSCRITRRADTPAGPPQYATSLEEQLVDLGVGDARRAARRRRAAGTPPSGPSVAVIASTSRLRSRVDSGPSRVHTPHAVDVR